MIVHAVLAASAIDVLLLRALQNVRPGAEVTVSCNKGNARTAAMEAELAARAISSVEGRDVTEAGAAQRQWGTKWMTGR